SNVCLLILLVFRRQSSSISTLFPYTTLFRSQVVTFDRSGKSFTSNILNIAVEQDFNRVEIEGHAPDAFEQIMATFEGQLAPAIRSEEHTSELQSRFDLVCRLLLEKKKQIDRF